MDHAMRPASSATFKCEHEWFHPTSKMFSTERFERALPLVADEHGFLPQRHRVEIHGLCRACRDAEVGVLARAGRRG